MCGTLCLPSRTVCRYIEPLNFEQQFRIGILMHAQDEARDAVLCITQGFQQRDADLVFSEK